MTPKQPRGVLSPPVIASAVTQTLVVPAPIDIVLFIRAGR
jgi:hypothetical protein